MISISSILTGGVAARRIAGYIGLVDSLDSTVSRLEKMYQKSAMASLELAKNTSNIELQKQYILQAVNRYNDASSVEDEYNYGALFGIYVGLSTCHSLLGDNLNMLLSIDKALKCYNKIYFDSVQEPDDIMETAYEGTESPEGEKAVRILAGILTFGLANITREVVLDISKNKINKAKILEENIRPIAQQLEEFRSTL